MSILAPVQLIRSVPSILSSDRKRSEMASYKQPNSIGGKIKLGLLKRSFTVALRDLEIHFGIKFYCRLFDPFAICHFIFSMSRGTLASSRTKPIAKFVAK